MQNQEVQPQFVALPEIWEAAKQKLPPKVWDYFAGGVDTETTLRRNIEAMGHFEFRPRILHDVHEIDTTTTFLGLKLAIPVMIAPLASLALIDPEGDLAMARAAGRVGTAHWLSTRTSHTPEEVANAASGPLIFQLYWRGDNDWCEKLVVRIEKLGFSAIALTVDAPVYGRRERDLVNRFDHRVLQKGIDVSMERSTKESRLTWEDVRWLKTKTKLPLIIKGIQCVEDAKLAIQHGVDAVYISNHGGRQLDYASPALEILYEMNGELKGKTEILVDGGFMRGSDVLKAVALGAKAVCVGKLAAWGLAAAGEEGVVRTFELLALELQNVMANTGQRCIADVDSSLIRRRCISL